MAAANKTDPLEMTEEEFAGILKGSLLVLTTSSPDKRDIYRLLFTSHAKGKKGEHDEHHAGLNLFYTDSGSLGIAPRKTEEKTGAYEGNLDEKALQQLQILGEQQKKVRHSLRHQSEFDADEVKIVGMTEDSGWKLIFDDKEQERQFVEAIIRKLKPKLRAEDEWLISTLHETGFPGPNLKPIQEHLEGSFNELVEIIYDAADELKIKNLRFSSSTNVAFVAPQSGKYFHKTFESFGDVLSREQYNARLMETRKGEAINANFIHIPDGQKDREHKTIDVLIREGLHTESSNELPANYARRELTEYLQELIGKRRSSPVERKRSVNIAWVTPDTMHNKKSLKISVALPNDYKKSGLPIHSELLSSPSMKPFDDAQVVVLMPENIERRDNKLWSDPNLGMVLNVTVTHLTDPESMDVPIILDNRSGGFNKTLDFVGDAFLKGRLMGDAPFYVAHTDEELENLLTVIKDVKQRAPIVQLLHSQADSDDTPLSKVPADGTFTLFIGGGHANNSKRDLEDAKNFGHMCAKNGWRIITGAGCLEGSMGATHTGFIQYHLEQLQETEGYDEIKAQLAAPLTVSVKTNSAENGKEESKTIAFVDDKGAFIAENIILYKSDLIEQLANDNLIPRDMFYGYSLKPILEMESPLGGDKPPPGITYFEAGNRVRRLQGLLAAGTKVFMPGSIGTDEEFEETVKQHLEARLRKEQTGAANESMFSDGTPDNQGTIIIYNRNGHLDKLLEHYGISNSTDHFARMKRETYNIKIVTSLKELKEASMVTEASWQGKMLLEKTASEPNTKMAI